MISLLVTLLLFCLIIWAARTLLAAFHPGPQVAAVVYVIIVVIAVVWLLQTAGIYSGGALRLR